MSRSTRMSPPLFVPSDLSPLSFQWGTLISEPKLRFYLTIIEVSTVFPFVPRKHPNLVLLPVLSSFKFCQDSSLVTNVSVSSSDGETGTTISWTFSLSRRYRTNHPSTWFVCPSNSPTFSSVRGVWGVSSPLLLTLVVSLVVLTLQPRPSTCPVTVHTS